MINQCDANALERWLDVPGYVGVYEVSDLGRIRSVPRLDRLGRPRRGVVLKSSINRGGYRQHKLCLDGGSRSLEVHAIVCTAFRGPRPPGREVRHLNGHQLDNRAVNLTWGTRQQNVADTIRHGKNANLLKEECPDGHPYDEANTYRYGNSRGCRECRRRRVREYGRRRRAARKKEFA